MLNFLNDYANSGKVRFHMPGHKGKTELSGLGNYISEIDITEIDGSDNLHDPSGIIMESQKKASKLFRAKETIYLVNGSTSGIYSAITGVLNPGEKLIMQRNSHIAAYNALLLGDIEAEYIYPDYSEELELALGIRPKDIEKALEEAPNIEAVFLTSPSYYGICHDLEEIADIVHRKGKILIVDEAHGSHLAFGKDSISALDAGADVVIQSTHKTLLGLTQTSMLHIGSDRVNIDKIKKMAKIYQSTSPSYVLMSSIDHSVTYLEDRSEMVFDSYYKRLETARDRISNIDGVKLVDEADLDGFTLDETKLVFSVDGLSGKELEARLRESGIELEMSDLRYGVALSSFADSDEDFRALETALEDIEKTAEGSGLHKRRVIIPAPKKKYGHRDSFYRETEVLSLSEAVGKVAGEMVIPYPPGIPLLVPGEVIDKRIVEHIETLLDDGHSVQGITDGKIETIREDCVWKEENL